MLQIPFKKQVLGILVVFIFPISLWSVDDWKKEMLLIYSEGAVEMNLLRAEGQNNNRLKDYATALQSMHREPRDRERVESALETFELLIKSHAEDNVGIASAYYRARIFQMFLVEPNLAMAKSEFRSVFDAYPGHFFGQKALLNWVGLELYHNSDRAMYARIALVEGYEAQLPIEDLRRSYHKMLGDAYRTSDLSKEKAFKHLKKAYEIGFSIPKSQADLVFSLGQLAEELDDNGYAIERYGEFVQEYNLDTRTPELREHIKVLSESL